MGKSLENHKPGSRPCQQVEYYHGDLVSLHNRDFLVPVGITNTKEKWERVLLFSFYFVREMASTYKDLHSYRTHTLAEVCR